MKYIHGKAVEIYPGIRMHPVKIIPEPSDATIPLPPAYENFVNYVRQKRVEMREQAAKEISEKGGSPSR